MFKLLIAGRIPVALLRVQDSGKAWKRAPPNQQPLKEALERAELESVTPYDLRHSYASTIVRTSAPLMVVAEALDHSDTRMVDKHYAHLVPSYVADTIRWTDAT